jgi:hypothetical protein
MSNQERPALLTVKLPPSRLDEFRIAAMLRGTTMSALVQQFVTQVVREEMSMVPEAFRRRSVDSPTPSLVDMINHNNSTS